MKPKHFVCFRIGNRLYWQEQGTDTITVAYKLDHLVPFFQDLLK